MLDKLANFYGRSFPAFHDAWRQGGWNSGGNGGGYWYRERAVELKNPREEGSWGGLFISVRQIRNEDGVWEFDCLAYGGATGEPLRGRIEQFREELEEAFPETRWYLIDSSEGFDHAIRAAHEPFKRDESESPFVLIICYAFLAFCLSLNGLKNYRFLSGLGISRFLRKKILVEPPAPDVRASFPRSQSN